MAKVTSHTLNSVDGSHAAGINVQLRNLGTGAILCEAKTDEHGRLAIEVTDVDVAARYELCFMTAPYWDQRQVPQHGARVMDEIVVRFRMSDPNGKYHLPIILSPHGYALWSSTEHG